MTNKAALRWTCILALMVLLSACGDSSSDLIGKWVQLSGARPESVLTLNEDGTGQFQPRGGVAYKIEVWNAKSEYLTMQIQGSNVIAQFKLDDSLDLSRVEDFEEFNGSYRKQ
jgi:hypothetical protein